MRTATAPAVTRQTVAQIAADAALVENLKNTERHAAPSERPETDMRRCPACHATCFHFHVEDRWICFHVRTHQPLPVVGMGASIRLYTDTLPAVITRVTPSTVTVRRVATLDGTRREDTHVDRVPGLPVTLEDGDLTAPTGPEETFRLTKTGEYRHGDTTLRIGSATRRIDYRF